MRRRVPSWCVRKIHRIEWNLRMHRGVRSWVNNIMETAFGPLHGGCLFLSASCQSCTITRMNNWRRLLAWKQQQTNRNNNSIGSARDAKRTSAIDDRITFRRNSKQVKHCCTFSRITIPMFIFQFRFDSKSTPPLTKPAPGMCESREDKSSGEAATINAARNFCPERNTIATPPARGCTRREPEPEHSWNVQKGQRAINNYAFLRLRTAEASVGCGLDVVNAIGTIAFFCSVSRSELFMDIFITVYSWLLKTMWRIEHFMTCNNSSIAGRVGPDSGVTMMRSASMFWFDIRIMSFEVTYFIALLKRDLWENRGNFYEL